MEKIPLLKGEHDNLQRPINEWSTYRCLYLCLHMGLHTQPQAMMRSPQVFRKLCFRSRR